MGPYEQALQSLREMKNDDDYTMDEALQALSEELQNGLLDEGPVMDEIDRAIKTFITECGEKA